MCTCLALTPVLECWQHCPFPEQHQVFWGFPAPYSICSSSGPWPHEIMYISYLMLLFPLWQYMIQGVLTSRKFIWSSASMVCVTFWKWHNFWRCILKDILFIKKVWRFYLHDLFSCISSVLILKFSFCLEKQKCSLMEK